MSLTMTEREFAFWLEHSSPTSQVIYHYGSLARDRVGKLVSKGEIIKQLPTTYSKAVASGVCTQPGSFPYMLSPRRLRSLDSHSLETFC